jgi:hypothetical protein
MEIVVTAKKVVDAKPSPGNYLGKRFGFSDELVLGSIKKDPTGPKPPAGTHSGSVTILRNVTAGDKYIPFPDGATGTAELLEYEATYALIAVAGVKEGQVTARGVFLGQLGAVLPGANKRFAITGGTEAYANARGEVIQEDIGDPKKGISVCTLTIAF